MIAIPKRLLRELQNLDVKNYKFESNTTHIILYIKQFKFIILEDYPFKPPRVYINEENIRNKLCHATKILELRECLCCNSILCSNNWSPTKQIGDIITEYNHIYEQIKNRFYLKILKFRNLRDWNLEDVYNIILDFL